MTDSFLFDTSDRAYYIRQIQNYLRMLGENAPINGFYDEQTAQSVKNFQTGNSIEPTGNVDFETFERLRSLAEEEQRMKTALHRPGTHSFPMQRGDSSENVRLLHRYLRTLKVHYPDLPSVADSSYYSEDTEKGVIYMQEVFCESKSGIVDAVFFERLENEITLLTR